MSTIAVVDTFEVSTSGDVDTWRARGASPAVAPARLALLWCEGRRDAKKPADHQVVDGGPIKGMETGLLRLGRIIGHATDPELAGRLHDLEHRECVEVITVSGSDIARHRLQATTDRGTRCEIVVPRTQRLANGSVLLLDADRAVVVRLAEQQYLALAPQSPAAALELGYFAGNMHWPVLFRAAVLCILMQGPEESYLERLQPMLQDGRIRRVEMPHG